MNPTQALTTAAHHLEHAARAAPNWQPRPGRPGIWARTPYDCACTSPSNPYATYRHGPDCGWTCITASPAAAPLIAIFTPANARLLAATLRTAAQHQPPALHLLDLAHHINQGTNQ